MPECRVAVAVLLSAALLAGCTVKRLPAREPPPYRAPTISLQSAPPPAGYGRIVIETDADPAIAELIVAQAQYVGYRVSGTGIATRRICTTPCVADLPFGEHELVLYLADGSRGGKIVVRAEPQPSIVRVALGISRGSTTIGFLGTLLASGSSVGLTLTLLADGSTGTILAGTAGLALGSALSYIGRPVVQRASYAQYPLPAP